MALDVTTVGGWLFSALAAFIAYKAATRTHTETTKDADKTVYVSAVTAERAKWREELRGSVAGFIEAASKQQVDVALLRRLKAEVVMRLNPRALDSGMQDKHKYDFKIIEAVEAIVTDLQAGTTGQVQPQLAALERNAQELLKQEWEKSKSEALSGRSKTPPAG